MTTITTAIAENGVARVTLSRPEVHNAFNMTLIQELTAAFRDLGQDPAVRVIVLAGQGKHFSAGADIDWMREQGNASMDDNRLSAREMAHMFEGLDRCPKPVVAVIQGAALGGGSGLACVADIVIGGPRALFGFTEVRLGIVPAVISPYVLRRLGYSQSRSLFLSGSRFGSEEALRIGMLHYLSEDLEAELDRVLKELLAGPPEAHRIIKKLAREVWDMNPSGHLEHTIETISRVRSGAEGREGLSAFLEKRPPNWI